MDQINKLVLSNYDNMPDVDDKYGPDGFGANEDAMAVWSGRAEIQVS